MKTRNQSEMLLAAVIIARSTSLLFAKTCLASMQPFNLLSLRFGFAFLALAGIFHKKLSDISRRTLLHGAILGASFFALMTTETYSLRLNPTSTVSLLENTSIILVPLLASLLSKHLPKRPAVVSAAIAFSGVSLVIMQKGGLTITPGILLCLAGALIYSGCILLTSHYSKEDNPLQLGILQIGFMALFATAAAFLFEKPVMPHTAAVWGSLAELVLVCSVFGFAFQPVAQRGTTPERAGLFCALSPMMATLLGCTFLKEHFTVVGAAGMLLILCAIFVSSVPAARKNAPAAACTTLRSRHVYRRRAA